MELEPYTKMKLRSDVDPSTISQWEGFYKGEADAIPSYLTKDDKVEMIRLPSRKPSGYFWCYRAKLPQNPQNSTIFFHKQSVVESVSTYFLGSNHTTLKNFFEFKEEHAALDEDIFEKDEEAWEIRLAVEDHFKEGDLITGCIKPILCEDIKKGSWRGPEHIIFNNLFLYKKEKAGMYCFGREIPSLESAYKEVFIPWGLAQYAL